jgi:hypothetical protein
MDSEFVFTLEGKDVPTNRTSVFFEPCPFFAPHSGDAKRETPLLQVSQGEGDIFRCFLLVWHIRSVHGLRAGPVRSEFPRETSTVSGQVSSVDGHDVINTVRTGFASTGPGTGSEAEAQGDSKNGPRDASGLIDVRGYLTTKNECGKEMRREFQ